MSRALIHGVSFERPQESGSEKGVFWKRGLLEKGSFLRDSREFRDLEILENPQTVESKEKSDHFLEILENLEILVILEIPPTRNDPFSGLEK